MATKATSKVVLFDLGGVLADLGDPVADMDLQMSREDFWRTWLGSKYVRLFETGQVTAAEFAPLIAQELRVDPHSFKARFEKWQLRLFPGVEALVNHVSGFARVALLSNTNRIHWKQVTAQSSVFERFDALFLSFETGQYKPDNGAFLDVLSRLSCEPSQILFLDDSEKNVDAARAIGMDTRLISRSNPVREELFQ